MPVCCGGSWSFSRVSARSAFRNRFYSNFRSNYIRFPCGVFVAHLRALIPDERRVSAASEFSPEAAQPRGDRPTVLGRTDDEGVQHVAAQASAIGMANMVDPALDAAIQFPGADLAGMVGHEPRPPRPSHAR